jgi:hypothetical protein
LALSESRQVMDWLAPRGVKRSSSMSSRGAWGSGTAGARPRETFTVGMSWRKCETLQRKAGNWK